jgi:putative ABC transport system permease protein
VWNDIRYALRGLARNPSFTFIALGILALGIGANTAIFSVVDGVLLRPLPHPHANRLVWGWGRFELGDTAAISPPDFSEYRAESKSFDRLAAFSVENGLENLAGGDQPAQVSDAIVSQGFFEALGAQPLLGRTFDRADEQQALPQVAVLSEGLWRNRFGADRGVIGKTISLGGRGMTVVGIMPASFDFPAGAELWLPIPFQAPGAQRGGHWLRLVGLLAPSATLASAQADLDTIAGRLSAQYPADDKGWGIRLEPLQKALVGDLTPVLLVLLGAVALVLLIACSNVAGLLIARALDRRREMALRQALGASHLRLARQLLVESILLAVLGGGLGVLLAQWGILALKALGPAAIPGLDTVRLNPTVLLATLAVSVVAGVLFGLAPAAETRRDDVAESLKEGERAGASRSRRGLRRALIVVEVSLSLVLLVGSGLLIHSLWRLLHVDPGFDASSVVTTQIVLADAKYPTSVRRALFFAQILAKLRAQPGVRAAGAISILPLSGQHNDNLFTIKGRQPIDLPQYNDARLRVVTPGYFQAMRIPLIAGRDFTDQDNGQAAPSMIVNEPFVRHYLPDVNPIGQHVLLEKGSSRSPDDVEIIGVVGGVRDEALADSPGREMYLPYAQAAPSKMSLVASGPASPGGLAAGMRAAVSAADPDEALAAFQTMPQVVASAAAEPRFSSLLIAIFAAVAVLLVAVGIYGVLAYSVAGRTREIGIRVALGARPPEILRLVLGEGMTLVAIGAAIGAVAALALGRLLASQLFEVGALDSLSFVVAVAVLAMAALTACWLPARRAMQVNPITALRHE